MNNFIKDVAFYRQPIRVSLMRKLLERMRWVAYETRLRYDALDRPEYGYPMYSAATLAKALGYREISVIEFGVATGLGLVNLERHAKEIKKRLDIDVQIYGFSLECGHPEPADYRDLPHILKGGYFVMDRAALEKKLSFAKLVLGDVSDTTSDFFQKYSPAPIGCLLFDLDYYSSTLAALKIFDTDPKNYLPRVSCFFNLAIANSSTAMNDFVGPPGAIIEFNDSHHDKKISKLKGLTWARKIPALWNEKVYIFHDFSHPKYIQHLGVPQNQAQIQ